MGVRTNARWWALGALILAVLAVGLDSTVLSIALPTLAVALKASETQLQWFIVAYTLVLAAGVLPAGLIGDRFGRKRTLTAALVVFGVGSAACAYSSSPAMLIAARAVLGFGAALIATMSLSALTVLFDEQERVRATGIWAAANFIALPLGPILGGWLLTNWWWGWVFLMNVPVVVLAIIAVAFLIPESKSERRPELDLPGIASSSGGLALLSFGLVKAGEEGWTTAVALLSLAAGIVLVGFFIAWERRLARDPGRTPLVDLALFSSSRFGWGTALAAVGTFALFGVMFTTPQYFRGIMGSDAMGSGLRLLPTIGGLVIGATSSERLARRIGAKITVAAGFAVMAIGMAVGAETSVATGDGALAVWTATVGIGMGLALAASASAALSQLSAERSGVGSGLMQATQKLGAPFAAAIMGSVLNTVYQRGLDLGTLPQPAAHAVRDSLFGGIAVAHSLGLPSLLDSVRRSFVRGMDVTLWISCAVAAAGIALSVAFLPGRTRKVDARDAAGVR